MAEHIFIVGMMGSGKTTIGRLLAKRLGWRHLDSDEQVGRDTGQTVPEIFAQRGEPAFRAAEARALAAAAVADTPTVVSVAGGAVLDPDNRHVLRRGGVVVWLWAPVETLAQRVGDGAGRPLLGDDPAAALRHLYAERRPVYQDLAQAVVDVDGVDVRTVVDRVLAALPLDTRR
ncbi:MAG TPA: shikimate kinase [Acidimicrobiales bacterium]|nr:shikimate kinase [Acidimicrobiales bacterium]